MLIGRRRSGPLSVDPLPALVDEHGGIASAPVQFGEAVRDEHAARVVPRAIADAIARVRGLIAIGGDRARR